MIGATSVSLSWGPVPFVAQNGEILGYKVSWKKKGLGRTFAFFLSFLFFFLKNVGDKVVEDLA